MQTNCSLPNTLVWFTVWSKQGKYLFYLYQFQNFISTALEFLMTDKIVRPQTYRLNKTTFTENTRIIRDRGLCAWIFTFPKIAIANFAFIFNIYNHFYTLFFFWCQDSVVRVLSLLLLFVIIIVIVTPFVLSLRRWTWVLFLFVFLQIRNSKFTNLQLIHDFFIDIYILVLRVLFIP